MGRLTALPTMRVDPDSRLCLTFGRQQLWGLAGDTVATALFANGVRIFGRSLKYHRPRGLYSLDGECANTCMAVDGIPNVFTETLPLKDGMRIRAQNVIGTPRHDLFGFMDRLDGFMPAGFYYRTLHRPAAIWPLAMKQVRKAAGLGKIAPDFVMPGVFDEIYPAADVCVIGGGPAGMCAALAAAGAGCRTILIEARPHLGGCFDYRTVSYSKDQALYQRARELAREVEETEGIRVLTRTSLAGVYGGGQVTAFQTGTGADPFDQRYVEVCAQSMVVATGCTERPLLFEHNERPGVMQAGCAHRLARTYGLVPGKEAVFSVGHDLGLEAAADLADLGVKICCVADIRQDGQDPQRVRSLEQRGIRYLQGWVAVQAHGSKGVAGVTLATTEGDGPASVFLRPGGRLRRPDPGQRSPDPGRCPADLRCPNRILFAYRDPGKDLFRRPHDRPEPPCGRGGFGGTGRVAGRGRLRKRKSRGPVRSRKTPGESSRGPSGGPTWSRGRSGGKRVLSVLTKMPR